MTFTSIAVQQHQYYPENHQKMHDEPARSKVELIQLRGNRGIV